MPAEVTIEVGLVKCRKSTCPGQRGPLNVHWHFTVSLPGSKNEFMSWGFYSFKLGQFFAEPRSVNPTRVLSERQRMLEQAMFGGSQIALEDHRPKNMPDTYFNDDEIMVRYRDAVLPSYRPTN